LKGSFQVNGGMPQRWRDGVFLLYDPIQFLKNDIRIQSESCFGWNHTIRVRKLSKSSSEMIMEPKWRSGLRPEFAF